MPEDHKQTKKEATYVKTFVVPFSLLEIKEDITISYSSKQKDPSKEILNQAYKFHLQGKISEAERYYKYCIDQGYSDFRLFSNYGTILESAGKLKEAVLLFREAIRLNPDFSAGYANLGSILNDIGNLPEAEIAIRKAIEINPSFEGAKYNLSLILLRMKNFKEGWIRYESRWKREGMIKPIFSLKPEWLPMNRGRVLLWPEQGIGDIILFSSLIPELVKKVDQLIVKTDKRLIPLFKRSFDKSINYIGINDFLSEEDYDYQIPIGSLPKIFRPSKESFKKVAQKQLKADEDKALKYKNKMKDKKYSKIVGISWRSESKSNNNKSLSLEEFVLGIYSPKICFVNLQYGDTKQEIESLKYKHNINIFEIEEVDNFHDLDGLSAIINACDEVVTIENVTLFLAGGLGIKSWVLLKNNCIWYNGSNQLKSDWYPSLNLVRKKNEDKWSVPLKKIQNKIKTQSQ